MKYVNVAFSVMILGSGCRVLSGGNDLGAVVLDKKPERMYELPHVEKVESARFNYDATRVVTTSGPLAWVWWLQRKANLQHLLEHKDGRKPVDAWFKGDGVAQTDVLGAAWFGDQRTEADDASIVTQIKNGKTSFLCWSPVKGGYAGTTCADEVSPVSRSNHKLKLDGTSVFVIDNDTNKVVSQLSHDKTVTWAEFSPDGTKVVTGTDSRSNGTVSGARAYVWRVGKTKQEIENEERYKKYRK